jgi:hypothetical protein
MTSESNSGLEELRREIAAAFCFDYANLSVLQSTKIDLIASLRLSLDDLQMRLASGDDTVDHSKLLSLSEILTKLLPQLADDDTRLKPQRLDARERLLALIEGAKVAAEANKRDEIAELKEKIDSLEATIRTLREAAATSAAVSSDPPSQVPSPPSSTSPSPWQPPSGPGRHYEEGSSSDFRDFVSPSGMISMRPRGGPWPWS